VDATPRRIPADRYRSPAFAALEAERLWPRVWQIACTVDCVREPGDWWEYEVGALSVLVVRGDDGALRGFQNACRHRGSSLLHGAGRGLREIRCPYHHWRYDLRGDLRATSDDGCGSGRPGRLSLLPVRVEAWGGLVFVNPDPRAEPLAEFLEALPDELAWVRMGEYTCRFALTVPVACNWKAVMDAFIETYHLHAVHPQMLAIADDVHTPITLWRRHTKFYQPYGAPSPRLPDGASDQIVWEEFVRNLGHRLGLEFAAAQEPGPHPPVPPGRRLRDVLVARIRAHLHGLGDPYPGLADDSLIDDFHYHVFPNAVFNVFAGWYGMIRARPGPTPDQCLLDMWNFDLLPEGHPQRNARPERVRLAEDAIAPLGDVMRQDIENLPRVQKGLSQPGLRVLNLVAAESRIGRMHQALDGYLGTSVEDEARAAEAR
jgi:nitrite reductase/ring-hydroxylating ferredoxin subunit